MLLIVKSGHEQAALGEEVEERLHPGAQDFLEAAGVGDGFIADFHRNPASAGFGDDVAGDLSGGAGSVAGEEDRPTKGIDRQVVQQRFGHRDATLRLAASKFAQKTSFGSAGLYITCNWDFITRSTCQCVSLCIILLLIKCKQTYYIS